MSVSQTVRDKSTSTEGFYIEPVEPAAFDSFSMHAIRHNYDKHPMLQLDALEKLAGYMMDHKKCRFVSPDIQLDSDFQHQSEHVEGKSLREVFAGINKPRSWIALYNIEINPEYREFLFEVIEGMRPLIEPEQGRIFDVGGFAFISAPPSITPFHIDRENNFWLQLRGRKRMTVFDNRDRELVSGKAVEEFIIHSTLKDVRYQESFGPKGRTFDTGVGDGVYFPSTSPHMTQTTTEWVTESDGVSVSLGVVFYTEFTRRLARVHQCNNLLRKFGIQPAPLAPAPPISRLREAVGYSYGSFKHMLRRYDPPPGAL